MQAYLTPNITTNIATLMANNSTKSNYVGSATCTNFVLSVTSPTTQNIGFIGTVQFLADAPSQTEQEFAVKRITNVLPPNTTTVDFRKSYTASPTDTSGIDNINAKNFIMQDYFSFKVNITPSYSIAQTVTLSASMNIHVKGIN
jgi:hypothetical protein